MPSSGEFSSVSKALPGEEAVGGHRVDAVGALVACTVWEAAASVPPVPMMSSTITAVLPYTSPITCPISATPCAGRSFSSRA